MNTLNKYSIAAMLSLSCGLYGVSAGAATIQATQGQDAFQAGASFISAARLDSADLLNLSSAALAEEVSATEKILSSASSEPAAFAGDKEQPALYEFAQNAVTAPNTLGMLLAGMGMIGFMVATRRQQ